MAAILTITLNPALDMATSAERVIAGPKLRCALPSTEPGGGGLNVSRAIAKLGGASTAFVAAGGAVGEALVQLLQAEAIALTVFEAPGATRQSLAVTDQSTGEQFRFVLPGPEWEADDVTAALAHIEHCLNPGMIVVLSGSQPPGVPVDFPCQLAVIVAKAGARLLLDTSGPALRHLEQAAQPGAPLMEVLRMDDTEAEKLAGRPLPTRKDSADFAQSLVRAGLARVVVLARGADGSTLATEDQRLHAAAADVPVLSKIGAGDSFVGAFALALSKDAPLAEALSRGSAAASAAVMSPGTQLCTREDAERLLPACVTAEV